MSEKIKLWAKKSQPPSRGSSDCAVTAEKVVRPAQKPGSSNKRNSVTPRRSIKTRRALASATPIKLAAKVPVRLSVIAKLKVYRTNVPATPPSETNARDFRGVGLSC